jgi:hypothetical protein
MLAALSIAHIIIGVSFDAYFVEARTRIRKTFFTLQRSRAHLSIVTFDCQFSPVLSIQVGALMYVRVPD